MSDAACKIVIDRAVQAAAKATADLLEDNPEAFPAGVVARLRHLDGAYLAATSLLHEEDEETKHIVAQFDADIAARAAHCAAERATSRE